MRLRVITCDMFGRELEAVASRSTNQIEIEVLPKALHQLTCQEMLRGLQTMIDHTDRARFQAVLLVCGACQQDLAGLRAGSVPLVLPRVKDCLSLLLDRKQVAPTPRQTVHYGQASNAVGAYPTSRLLEEEPVYWVVPVHETDPVKGKEGKVAPPSWEWRARFSSSRRPKRPLLPRKGPRKASTRCHLAHAGFLKSPTRPGRLPLLQLLVDGYWSYTDFLVVPVGWQVVATAGGMGAEELPT